MVSVIYRCVNNDFLLVENFKCNFSDLKKKSNSGDLRECIYCEMSSRTHHYIYTHTHTQFTYLDMKRPAINTLYAVMF